LNTLMNMLQECVTISLFCSSDSSICLLTNAYKDAVAHLVCYLICLLITYHCTFILSRVTDVKHRTILMQNSCIPKFFNQITFSFLKVVDNQIKNTWVLAKHFYVPLLWIKPFGQFYLILHIAINYNYVYHINLTRLVFPSYINLVSQVIKAHVFSKNCSYMFILI
jgi:hypothetical protein